MRSQSLCGSCGGLRLTLREEQPRMAICGATSLHLSRFLCYGRLAGKQ
ncbi:hypothetical protein thalar_01308 [Litoreibacter arenae DSM 19593]|uniref:Uncharacterized protein n=1 Tax=Litoreibacter arenae DSM 19593 TaxID=1123360 RepID=S9QJI5_9RHOB|nr:hypothetical protein thalar_01308 [Litoreibacter arenae DSM 19593]